MIFNRLVQYGKVAEEPLAMSARELV